MEQLLTFESAIAILIIIQVAKDGFWHRYEVLGLWAVKCRASRLPPYQSPEISQQLGFIIALLSVDSCLPAIAKIHHLRRCTKVTIISNHSLQQPLAQVHSKGSPAKPLSLLSLSSFLPFLVLRKAFFQAAFS
jgi:hypothetical protein